MPSAFDLSKLRVTFVAGTLGQGGAERQLFYILQTLVQSGADTRLLTLTSGEFWEPKLRAAGVKIVHVGASSSRAMRLGRIAMEVRRHRSQVCQSQHFYTNIYTALTGRALGIRDIGAIRNDVFSEVAGTGRLGTWSLRMPGVLAANSSAAIRNAETAGIPRQRLRLLPNVVDTAYFVPVGRDRPGPVGVVAVGRLVEQKNYPRLFSIVASVRSRSHAEFRVRIFGSGPLRESLERLASELGLLPGVIEFCGLSDDMRQVYAGSDILVSTSDYEGTPNVVMECMAMGLPIVATDVGGVSDLLAGATRCVVAGTGDEQAMADGLQELIESAALRREAGAEVRRIAETRLSVASLSTHLKDLYGYVLK